VVNRNAKGKYVAIEGNTRVQIYRDFQREGIKGDWSRIPAVVHRNLASKAIDAIRLQAHLVGPRPWDPYSKARYLNDLRSKKNLTMEQIVEFCGGRKKQVLDYIAAYQDMEQFYRAKLEPGESFDPTRFSAFVELQRPDVQQAVQAAGFSKGDFAKWVIDDLFGPLQTIRQLPRILGHNDAKVVFLRDGAQEAMKLLDVPPADTSLALASMTQIALELSRRISKLEFGDIQRLKSHPTGDERDVLLESRTRLEELFTLIADEGNG
jgi:hypothetical protein